MIRVVLDTSVLVSAVISPTGPNAQVFDLITAGKIRPYLTEAVLAGLLETASIKVKPRGRLKLSGHEDDNRIYECAVAAKADYIVTENTKHFEKSYKTTKIITARRLMKLLENGK